MSRSPLRQAEGGRAVEEICRKLGMSEATFPRWRKQFAGMGTVEIRRLKQLEEENAKLKRLLADLSMEETMLRDVLRKMVRPGARRDIVGVLRGAYDVSDRGAEEPKVPTMRSINGRAPEGCAANLLWVRHFAIVEDLRQALLAFCDTYNTTWLIQRHGFQTPTAVSQQQLQPVAIAA